MVPERVSDKYRKHVSPQIKGPGMQLYCMIQYWKTLPISLKMVGLKWVFKFHNCVLKLGNDA